MKKVFSTLLAIGIAFQLNAQDATLSTSTSPSIFTSFSAKKANASSSSAFEKGNVNISAGYGFPSLLNPTGGYEDNVDYSGSSLGPLFFKFGYAVSENAEIGLNVNYSQAEATFKTTGLVGTTPRTYNNTFKYNSFSALVRYNKHFGVGAKLDPYWTVSLGYRSFNTEYVSADPDLPQLGGSLKVPFSFEVGIGARYFFAPNIGIYAEAGITRAPFQLGLVARF